MYFLFAALSSGDSLLPCPFVCGSAKDLRHHMWKILLNISLGDSLMMKDDQHLTYHYGHVCRGAKFSKSPTTSPLKSRCPMSNFIQAQLFKFSANHLGSTCTG